ncbi:MAG: CHASE2 domain-containing protein, partial [Acetobacteraceae bacterium]|nr:CHASE2 domain-containing protein [Acetobacteraceae bacterium]
MPRTEDTGWRRLLRPVLRRTARVLLAAPLVALLVVAVRGAGWLQPLELAFHDAALRHHAAAPEDRRIALVIATEEDIERFGWPLPDGVLATLIERLLGAGAEVVAMDLYRDRPVGEGGEALAALLTREDRILWAYRLGDAGHRGIPPPAPLRGTGRAAFADVVADAGEVVRRSLIAAEDPSDGRVAFSLGAALAMRLAGERPRPAGAGLAFGRGVLRILDEPFGPYARLDAAGYQLLLTYRGGFPRVSVAEAMDAPPALLAGRGVVVGMDSLSVRDSFTTPLTTGLARGTPLPGAAIHAHTAAQMLRVAAGAAGAPEPPP